MIDPSIWWAIGGLRYVAINSWENEVARILRKTSIHQGRAPYFLKEPPGFEFNSLDFRHFLPLFVLA